MAPAQHLMQQSGGGGGDNLKTVRTVQEHMLPHLQRIFASYADPEKKWKKDQIKAFLETQEDPLCQDLLAHTELDFKNFLNYMTSSHTTITSPHKPTDLSWPLASYYISSSHNTYLTGNQLSSDSTTEAYTNVLARGCRCVEVDVWDGEDTDSESSSDEERRTGEAKKKRTGLSRFGSLRKKLKNTSLGKKKEEVEATKKGPAAVNEDEKAATAYPTPIAAIIEPRVLHGYTLTKDITFHSVAQAIRKSAFAVTDTPLIVSLEVHCNASQQKRMVEIMNEAWGDVLVSELDKDPTELPSPGELMGKILIKVKYAPPSSSPDEVESGEDNNAPTPANAEPNKPSKIIQELSRMGIYTRGVTFKSFTQPEASMPTHVFSLAEKKYLDHHEKKNSELWEHNKQYLMRAYPSGLRIGSSNLNPTVFWGSGTQIVALNWQQTDEGMMLNEGMFSGTGGYVLKPSGYRPDRGLHPDSMNRIIFKTLNLTLTFYAAQSIPLPPDDKSAKGFQPYIKVELHVDASEGQKGGHIKDDGHEREGEYKAKTKTHRGVNFDLGRERLEFKGISGLVEDLTFLRFTVRDNEIGKDDLAAWACVRLDRLGLGYRFIHLLDAEGKLTEGAVLVKVEKELI